MILNQTTQRVIKGLGYSSFFFTAFFIFLLWSFPVDRFTPAIERELTNVLEREVKIGDFSMSPFGNVSLSDVEIGVTAEEKEVALTQAALKKPKPGAAKNSKPIIPPAYILDEISINVGLIALLFNELNINIDVEAIGGTIDIEYEGPLPGDLDKKENIKIIAPPGKFAKGSKKSKSRKVPGKNADTPADEDKEEDKEEEVSETELTLFIEIENINLKRIHDLRQLMPVPISGDFNMTIDLVSPTGRFADADGEVDFYIKGLQISKPKFEAEVFDMKMAVPQLVISSVEGIIEFIKGEGVVEKFEMKSKHLDVGLKGMVNLADPLSKTRHTLYITFKLLQDYVALSSSIETLVNGLDLFSRDMKRAHRDDGYYGFRYRGTVGKGRFKGMTKFKMPKRRKSKGLKSKQRSASLKKRKSRSSSRKKSSRPASAAQKPAPKKKSAPTAFSAPTVKKELPAPPHPSNSMNTRPTSPMAMPPPARSAEPVHEVAQEVEAETEEETEEVEEVEEETENTEEATEEVKEATDEPPASEDNTEEDSASEGDNGTNSEGEDNSEGKDNGKEETPAEE
jgi:hypothetical protein